VPPEYPGFHDVYERLAEWRREVLTRMRRYDELALLPAYPRLNFAAEPRTLVRVDSHLGTQNTECLADVYFRVADPANGICELGNLDFSVEDSSHPTLSALRRMFPLDAVAGSGSELERAIRIRDWIKALFPHFMPYRMPVWNALTILDRGSRGVENFLCIHYSVCLVQSCLALSIQARLVNIHRGIAENYVIGEEAKADPPVDEHVVAEVWSSDTDSWVMLDTDYNCHYERDGVPLSAWQIHRAFVDNQLADLVCHRGPHSRAFTAFAESIADEGHFFSYELPSYYAHVSILMRNDFLSDPDGPVPVAHLLDDATPPIVWHQGSDLRLQPNLMGPVVVATPYTDLIRILTDGNTDTGWASSDNAEEHWVEVTLVKEQMLGQVALHWPEYATRYRTSRRIRIDALIGDGWQPLSTLEIHQEGPFTLHTFGPLLARAIRIVQSPGDGHPAHPNRLWLNQVEVLPYATQ
jgi:hypothetical protein